MEENCMAYRHFIELKNIVEKKIFEKIVVGKSSEY